MLKPTPSPEQQKVIDTWGEGLAVLAGAGSGKTTTLVEKCAQLMRLHPKSRFVAVSFTERSAGDLKSKLFDTLLELQGPGSLQPHWVMTIHGLCAAVIREFPKESGLDGEETILTDSDSQLLWQKVIEGLWMEDLPEEIRTSFERLLDRETRDTLAALLRRVRDLFSFGVLPALSQNEDPIAIALEQVGRYVIEKYERLKRRRGVLDFNDLERAADLALSFPNVRSSYHQRFNLVLVDEFQDTNVLQSQIISRFARPDRSNLCVVGDPKQSIYRFRDADVTVFEEFCSQLPVRQSLTWNFRSRPGIIEFANQLCQKTFAASEMHFESLAPQREAHPHLPPVVRLDLTSPQELGAWIRGEVERGIPLQDMALLVRKVRGNEKWFKALASEGVPIALGSGGLFWEDPRVRELVSFLKWWDQPGNSLSGAIFLRAPWVGIQDVELDKWNQKDPTWREPFFSSSHPLALVLQSFLNQVVRPGELLMSLLVDQRAEDELAAPLMGLWHRVEELSSRGLDFHSVVMDLSSALEENRRERQVPAPRNLGQLCILTLHGAKGLEFPHVILIDLSGKSRASDMPLLFWDRLEGACVGLRDSNGDRDREHPLEVKWREREKKKNLEESKRLFYVALTRARERLILVCQKLQKEIPAEFVFQQDDWRGWIDYSGLDLPQAVLNASALFCRLQEESIACVKKRNTQKQSWVRARHSVTEWNLLSHCPRAYEWKFIRPVLVPTATISTIHLAQEVGTRVHACLENGNFDGLFQLEKEVGATQFTADPIVRWASQFSGMAPSDRKQGREVWTELSFEVPLGQEIMVGSIDRLVRVVKSGGYTYSILDFKVTQRSQSPSSLLKAYATQMELYGWALCALDPKIQLHEVEASLVHISTDRVQVVPIPLGKQDLGNLVKLSVEIINGASGEPLPSGFCRICEFQPQCPQAAAFC